MWGEYNNSDQCCVCSTFLLLVVITNYVGHVYSLRDGNCLCACM